MGRLEISFLAALLATVDAPAAQDFAKPFVEIAIAAARLECETQGGAFDPEIEKVVWELPDLNGYDRADLALDRSGFLCDGANAIYGDAQGWQLSVLVSGDEGGGHFRFQALDWRIVEWRDDVKSSLSTPTSSSSSAIVRLAAATAHKSAVSANRRRAVPNMGRSSRDKRNVWLPL